MEKKKLDIKEIGMEKLVVIFLCCVFLLLLSMPQKSEETAAESGLESKQSSYSQKSGEDSSDSTKEYEERMEQRLKEILQKVHGIGAVEVMITIKASKEKVTLKDSPYSEEKVKEKDSTGGIRESQNRKSEEETVLIDGDGNTSVPYVLKEVEPEIEGVLVLAENGSNSALKTEIMEAVQVLFDVPSHKIKVMKMQANQ